MTTLYFVHPAEIRKKTKKGFSIKIAVLMVKFVCYASKNISDSRCMKPNQSNSKSLACVKANMKLIL